MFKRRTSYCFAALLFLALAICPILNADDRIQWINHTLETLADRPIQSSEELASLRKMTDNEVIDYAMSQPGFTEVLFKFFRYYLRAPMSHMRSIEGILFDSVVDWPAAISAALAYEKGKDASVLWRFKQPQYAFRTVPRRKLGPLGSTPPKQIPSRVVTIVHDRITGVLADGEAKGWNRSQLCSAIRRRVLLRNRLLERGLFFHSNLEWGFYAADKWPEGALRFCNLKKGVSYEKTAKRLRMIKRRLQALFTFRQSIDRDVYAPKRLHDLKIVPSEKLMVTDRDIYFTNDGFWRDQTNTKDNINRRRGDWALRTFFCQELDPTGVIPSTPPEPETVHGGSAACESCHYRLDPMAGFFRDYGRRGANFFNLANIAFDGGNNTPRSAYEENWINSQGEYEVGFVQSPDPEHNLYGASMGDLFSIIRESRTAQRCFVQRAQQYFVGPKQQFDRTYTTTVLDKYLQRKEERGFNVALKGLISQLVTSKTFRHHDPDPTQCYDFGKGVDPSNRPPCQVAGLFEKYCGASCHNKAAKTQGLDLTTWKPKLKNFVHEDPAGGFYGRGESFEIISQRLSSHELSERMPPAGMPDADRQLLLNWLLRSEQ